MANGWRDRSGMRSRGSAGCPRGGGLSAGSVMAKIAALGAYFYQAALAFGLLILVSNLLPSAEYTSYSLFISITQFVSIVCFEWIKFACSRFYPGPDAGSEAAERSAMLREFVACSGVCVVGAVVAIALGVPLAIAVLGALAAVIQGGSEIHLTVLRFRQDFRLFSRMQGMRATILAVGTCAGAAMSRDFAHVLAGLMAGYGVYMAAAFAVSRGRPLRLTRWDVAVTRRHLVYGSVSASASIAAMLAPLGLKAILTATLGPAGAAGPMLALDLLQRPFTLILSSLQAIRYPELVALFDRDGAGPELRRALGRYYTMLASFAFLGGAGIMALLGLAGAVIIAPDLGPSFARTAPFILLMALLRSLVQTWLPTPAHLQRRLVAIASIAVLDSVLMCAGALLGAVGWGSDVAIAIGAAAGAVASVLCCLAVLRLVPFEMALAPVLLSVAALLAAWGVSGWFGGDLVRSTTLALAAAALAGIPALYQTARWIAR